MKEDVKMSPTDALQILRNAAANITTNLSGHEMLQKALSVIHNQLEQTNAGK